jgi:hypothetical protein
VRVERGEELFRLVTLGNTNFYVAFRTKFNFRIRPEAVPSRHEGIETTPVAPRAPSIAAAESDHKVQANK